MLGIEAEDPDRRLTGLDNRLKGRERLAEKVQAAMAEKNRGPDEAFATVKDAIRYTFQYTDDKYTAGVYADCARLEAAGFKPYDRVNSWEHDQYKGINSRWREPNSGFLLEVQFHTQASFEAKEQTHAAYEKLRGTPAPPKDEQARLAEFQRQVTAGVPIPSGASEVPDYSYK